MSERKEIFVSDSEKQEQREYSRRVSEILSKRYPDRMPMAHLHTYGCQQNVNDGEKIKGMLAVMGYGFCNTPQDADLVIYNTCAVRENAEDKVFGNVGQLVHCKRARKDMIIGLCGCMTQQPHIAEKIRKSYPYVDLVFGTHVLHKLPELLYRTLTDHKRVFDIENSDGVIAEDIPVVRTDGIKAWLPIMYGCNNFCTYCVVPYVRGRERSRHSADIIAEAKQLIADGYKEITLLGQNVNSYGKGLEENINFSKLLRMLNDLDGDFILRFMTSHPKDATPELIDTIVECEKVCKHLHLPVQSGSDRILDLMNRHYHVEDYRKLIAYARKKIPDISFTSDIIVGFPNETEEDFQATLDLIREVRYHFLYTFIYSKRVGTKAAAMEDLTPEQEKSRRFRELLSVQEVIGQEIYDKLVGTTCRVLVDGEGKSGEGYLTGRTEQSVIVDFQGDKQLIDSFVPVRITKALRWAVIGELDV